MVECRCEGLYCNPIAKEVCLNYRHAQRLLKYGFDLGPQFDAATNLPPEDGDSIPASVRRNAPSNIILNIADLRSSMHEAALNSEGESEGAEPSVSDRGVPLHEGVGQPHEGVGQPHAGVGQPHAGVGQPHAGVGQPYEGVGQPHEGVGQQHDQQTTDNQHVTFQLQPPEGSQYQRPWDGGQGVADSSTGMPGLPQGTNYYSDSSSEPAVFDSPADTSDLPVGDQQQPDDEQQLTRPVEHIVTGPSEL